MPLDAAGLDERPVLRIVHALPGRLRLRVPAHVRADELVELIRGLAGVQSWFWSERTRGLLILFDAQTISAGAIIQAVARQFRIDTNQAQDPSLAQHPDGAKPPSTFASGVAETFGELDRHLQRTTRGLLSVGVLVPIALTLWAARELALGRAAPLAWSSALWYAHGLFRDYQVPPARD